MVDREESKTPKRRSGLFVLRRIMTEMRGYRSHLVGIALLGAVIAPLALMKPLALKIAIDSYLGDDPLPGPIDAVVPDALLGMDDRFGYLLLAAGMVVIVAILHQSLTFSRRLLRTYTKERLVLGFRTRLFGHVERLSLSYHDKEGPSESTFKVLMDTAVIPGVLLDGLIPSLQALVMLSVIAVVIVALSPTLALIAVLIAPILLLISWPFGRSLRKQWHAIKELDTSVMGRLQEAFSAVRVIKTFGREEGETDKLFELAERSVGARVRVAITQGKFQAATAIAMAGGSAVFLVIGAQMVRGGELALGDLVMIAALMVQFYAPLQLVVGQVASMQSALASAERALELLDRAPEVIERPDAQTMERAEGSVEFRNVRFAYEENQAVLGDVSFSVRPGQRVGIAGATGAGKTTLMNLLTRLYDPNDGAILLDGLDIRDLTVDSLREQFAVVLQEPLLFKKSVIENIRYGVPEASTEATVEAAKLANAHGFISEMSEGYETVVGDRGQRLSGGERQRISLARAFLKDAPILILDEPTSSVDMRTEATIMEALQRLMEGRTTFVIAHRPSTLEFCDKVLVLKQGRVVAFTEPGSLDSLHELMLAAGDEPAEATP